MENKWYAVQETSNDAWDHGSEDFDEAKEMLIEVLKEKGRGLIAVIENDYCSEEIYWDEIFDIDYLGNEALAGIVRNAGAWDDPYIEDCMIQLCKRADVPAEDESYESWDDPARKVQENLGVDLGV